MTGGQPNGGFHPLDIMAQLKAEGVGRVVMVTDEPDKYGSRGTLLNFGQDFAFEDAIGSHACSLELTC
jgi:hypothetical protein